LSLQDLQKQIASLPPDTKAALDRKVAAYRASKIWAPQPGPQTIAFETDADIVLYGGAAGGGKTDLIAGLALTQHRRSIIFRREHKQLSGVIERIIEIRGSMDGYNGQDERFALPDGRLIRLGGMKNLGDEKAYQGRPFDLMAFDELTEFLEQQFRFVLTWNRSTTAGQRCRVVCASNPPTSTDGEWVIQFWGPWLDPQHPNPAAPGELRWFISDEEGKDKEVPGPEPVEVSGEMVSPRSRTFIPSSVDDNSFLTATGYKATLQALPEPLRSQMLKGDFTAGKGDNPWQVIPTEWVEKAQARWQNERPRGVKQSAVGADIARGGKDETILSPRYDYWFAEQLTYPGKETPDGPAAAALIVGQLRDGAIANVDVIGVGTSVYDHLKGNRVRVAGLNGSEKSEATDKSGKLRFVNKRAEWFWRFREALDPDAGKDLALPPSRKLKVDLTTPRWKLTSRGIQVESKEEIIKRIGRSPDAGDSAVYAYASAGTPAQARGKINYPQLGVV
jgi:hypothetical protein